MNASKLILAVILGFTTFALPCSFSYSADLSSMEVTTQTINVPLTTWNELKSNNEKALTLIRQSRLPLTEAQALTVKQASELKELKSINIKQSQELMKAQNDLMRQKDYLNEMNSSLEMLSKDIKRNKATEQRLHRQRNRWAIVSGLLLVGLAVK
ncbi:hypothetical protein [Veillonella sp. CNR 79/14]|uniref:hypothetical protein n=1 Tax=Veillonella sp. CNR 79/14 TaxID=2490954 RepID=UPI000F8E78D3|nr:hypothetical protein [Veillonella sp. CNR 79/14]